MNRRSFLAYGVGLLGSVGVVSAQKGIMEGTKAVVCDSDSITCPNGHKTCRKIDKPVVVGNDSREYPDQAQLYDFHLLCCDVCRVAFFG